MPLRSPIVCPDSSRRINHKRLLPLAIMVGMPVVLTACQPTVRVEAPDKPIEINLNVKIEQEVRVKIEREVEDLFEDNPDIF